MRTAFQVFSDVSNLASCAPEAFSGMSTPRTWQVNTWPPIPASHLACFSWVLFFLDFALPVNAMLLSSAERQDHVTDSLWTKQNKGHESREEAVQRHVSFF